MDWGNYRKSRIESCSYSHSEGVIFRITHGIKTQAQDTVWIFSHPAGTKALFSNTLSAHPFSSTRSEETAMVTWSPQKESGLSHDGQQQQPWGLILPQRIYFPSETAKWDDYSMHL